MSGWGLISCAAKRVFYLRTSVMQASTGMLEDAWRIHSAARSRGVHPHPAHW